MRRQGYLFLILVAGMGIAGVAFAQDSATMVKKGNRQYKEKKYPESVASFFKALALKPDAPAVQFNLGAAQYKSQEIKAAAESFEKALASPDKNVEAMANYNLACAKYKLGKAQEAGNDLQSAGLLLQEALSYFKRSIELDEKDADKKYNYELTAKELKLLQEKQKQQPQPSQGKPQQEQNQQQGQNQKQGQNQQQSQNQEHKNAGAQEDKAKEQAAQEEKARERAAQQAKQKASLQGQEKKESAGDLQQMSPREAKMLLEGYRQEEAGQGRLHDQEQGKLEEVAKDW